ncbi:acyltransferase, partial [Bacillus safensis]|nr:acyltransferase [Bacillus safensis]
MQIKEIFFIRCISCLSVVLIHAIAILSSPHSSSILVALLMFSTPSFIFISEFL